MYCGSNLYFHDAQPFRKEPGTLVCSDVKPEVKVVSQEDGIYLEFDFGDKPAQVETVTVTTDSLGIAFEPELPYEQPDGTPLCIENDFFGNARPAGKMTVGPFEGIVSGVNKIKVAEI